MQLEGEEAKAQRELGFSHEKLGLKWLRVLCHHAPDMAALHDVLLSPVISTYIDQLEGAICAKIRKYNFPTKSEVTELTKVVQVRREQMPARPGRASTRAEIVATYATTG